MEGAARVPSGRGGAAALASAAVGVRTPTEDQIRAQAEKILETAPLARSSRSRKLLQYIIDQTLAGNAKRLKQYCIATEALGRGTDFDPDTDPIVRLEASKLRRALEDYYLRSGANDPIRISIPKGSYVPSFDLLRANEELPERTRRPAAQPAVSPDAGAVSAQRLLVLPMHLQLASDTVKALTDGLYEQLHVELARYRDISVVTPRRAEQEDVAATDPVSAGLKAQARFVVSGSVRHDAEHVRITVRLHDTVAGCITWIECFDLAAGGLGLHTEDQIARHVAGAIADYYGVISHALGLQAVHAVDRPWNLQDAIQRHRYLARTLSERVYRVARADLEIGAMQAAYHPMIWAALAHTIFYGNVLGFDEDENWMTVVYRYAQRSFEIDHRCAFGHVVMALHGLYQREFDDVFETCKRISQDNPHAPSTKLSAGFFRALAGDWEAGTQMLESALSVLVHPPGWAYRVTFLNHYRKRRYGEALHEIDKYHAPENVTPPLLRAAALAELGRMEEASNSIAEVLRICPRFKDVAPRYFRYLTAFDDIGDQLMVGLQKAGLSL